MFKLGVQAELEVQNGGRNEFVDDVKAFSLM